MKIDKLKLMSTMLDEVTNGTWVGTPVEHKVDFGPIKLFPKQIEHFNLEDWVDMVTKSDGTKCGFSACAVGHACYDARFQALGLNMHSEDQVPVFGRNRNWTAVSKFFDLTEACARVVFTDVYYEGSTKYGVKPAQVKSRIDELLVIGEEELVKKYPNIYDTTGSTE